LRSRVAFGLSAILALALAGCGDVPAPGRSTPPAGQGGIISLAPSITEIVFALDAGDQLSGVTRFCRYPPEARTITPVGGFEDINLESIAALNPAQVIALDAHGHITSKLTALGYPVVTVRHETVEGILESIMHIGAVCDRRQQAESLVLDIRHRMRDAASRTHGGRRPRVLMAVGGALAPPDLSQVYIAGRGGFYDSIIGLAGGTNAYEGNLIFPCVSAEGILHMSPDVIIDLVADLSAVPGGRDAALARWDSLPSLPAVSNRCVHLLEGDFVTIPGPRFILILEAVARILGDAAAEPPKGSRP
jgi:iron complex transport system substrate-binding protein